MYAAASKIQNLMLVVFFHLRQREQTNKYVASFVLLWDTLTAWSSVTYFDSSCCHGFFHLLASLAVSLLALAAVQHLSAPSNAGELRILAAEGLSASWMKEFEAAFGMFFCCCFFFDSKFMVITRFGASWGCGCRFPARKSDCGGLLL